MKLIIAGSRTFDDYALLCKETVRFVYSEMYDPTLPTTVNISNIISLRDLTIISGMAIGADTVGCKFAESCKLKLITCPANWNLYGKRAGYIRNDEMAKLATHAIVFWDGKSKGSKHMIDLCVKHNVKHKIVRFGL